ncbi:hypothetical protein CTAYLR_003439 [Chrysophaeum taylorii]|uniref:O-fucosyltransferase family protein n=1 Tax=Chrysophaeum taylorii TaxID=2483200 RepID=A0AAD7U9B0_9STRA|nr:hypothetical protein CTAYLR_003439 [Chrysophaeum taylorii]
MRWVCGAVVVVATAGILSIVALTERAVLEQAKWHGPERERFLSPPAARLEALESRLDAVRVRLDRVEGGPRRQRKKPVGERGRLVCDGREIEHEIVYWREVAEDKDYVAPTASNRGYLTFEYDRGGWNNVRMGVECLVVVAHAMGRTLVAPPAQNLYLLGAPQVDATSGKPKRKKMGFADFFDLEKLGERMSIMTMAQFLARQATEVVAAKGPPKNKTDLWGTELWSYLKKVADATPTWNGALLALPRSVNASFSDADRQMTERYAGGRAVAKYDASLRAARHVHVPAGGKHRILQHHYAFAFFADPRQRAFYRRLIRDTMRYVDPIQCAGAKLVDAVRRTSRDLGLGGKYYALHVRRGDFQFKSVKLPASKIVQNLRGNDIIPRGSLVFVATDDPDGVCVHCRSGGAACPDPNHQAPGAKMPDGCPADPSWDAFWRNGWILVFSRNFTTTRHASNVAASVDGINPNYLGMAESIVCSRAEVFAGTWFSTFTGYIHRLRGFHGLGENTYYHSTGRVDAARSRETYGRGYVRPPSKEMIEDELWKIFTYYTLNSNPLEPGLMSRQQLLRLCRDTQLVRTRREAASAQIAMRKNKLSFDEFLEVLGRLREGEFGLQKALLEHVLPLASRRTASEVDDEPVLDQVAPGIDAVFKAYAPLGYRRFLQFADDFGISKEVSVARVGEAFLASARRLEDLSRAQFDQALARLGDGRMKALLLHVYRADKSPAFNAVFLKIWQADGFADYYGDDGARADDDGVCFENFTIPADLRKKRMPAARVSTPTRNDHVIRVSDVANLLERRPDIADLLYHNIQTLSESG